MACGVWALIVEGICGIRMSKYEPLRIYLTGQAEREVSCSFSQIEAIIGDRLPRSAHVYPEWWANEKNPDTSHVQCRAWRDAGYSASPDLEGQQVAFTKM